MDLFAGTRVFQMAQRGQLETTPLFRVLGLGVTAPLLWAAGIFVALAALTFLFTVGPQTGLKWLDSRTHIFIDLLIDTEAELAKVSWPSSEVLSRSTAAVLVAMVLLGIFLFCVDSVVAFVMGALRVLPH
jgi:preprotein translocase SecE subunit